MATAAAILIGFLSGVVIATPIAYGRGRERSNREWLEVPRTPPLRFPKIFHDGWWP